MEPGATARSPCHQGIWPSDALYMYDAMVVTEAEKARLQHTIQQAAQEIAHLQGQLQQAADREQQANAAIAKFMDYMVAARAENAQLKDKHASEIAKLNQEHAKVYNFGEISPKFPKYRFFH